MHASANPYSRIPLADKILIEVHAHPSLDSATISIGVTQTIDLDVTITHAELVTLARALLAALKCLPITPSTNNSPGNPS
jgi:hypothetical protein